MKLIAAILLSCFFLAAYADEGDEVVCYADTVLRLREISVVADPYRKLTPSQQLSGPELQALNALSVADAIRYFSGIQIKDFGGIGGLKTVDVRSLGSHHVGVFYDGLPIGNAQNGQVDLGKFSLDQIEEIKLFNGQRSDVLQTARDYGSSAGIYLRTRRPYFADGSTFHLKGTIKSGSFGLVNPTVLYEQRLTENLSASLNAEFLSATGRYKFRYRRAYPDGSIAWDTTYRRANGEIEALRIEAGLYGQTDRGRWNGKVYYYDSSRGIPGAVIANMPQTGQHQWDRNFFTQASAQKRWTDRLESMINAKYARDYMAYENPDTQHSKPAYDRFTQQEIYLSLANRYALLTNLDLSLSTDYQLNTLNVERKYPLSEAGEISPRRNTLLVALAAAWDMRRLKIQANLLATFIDEHTSGSFRDAYTPALFLYYRPFHGRDFSLRAFYKQSFRLPTFNDLYYTDVQQIALNPERTAQYDLGFQWELDIFSDQFRLSLQADAYYNRVTDKIISVPKGSNLFHFTTFNLGKVEIKGLDISARLVYRIPRGPLLSAQLQYTYQRAQDFSYPEDKGIEGLTWGGQIPYMPRHSGGFSARAEWKDWNFTYSFLYVGERYDSSDNDADSRRLPYYTSDCSLSRLFVYKAIRCRLAAEINNCFDQQYDIIPNYPLPGRSYRFTLSVEI